MKSALYDEMFRMEERHWWFCARRRIVLTLLRQKLERAQRGSPKTLEVCDLGAGCGSVLLELSKRYTAVGMDLADEAIGYSRARGVTILRGRLPDRVPFQPARFDAVLALDVIEHVADDVAAVQASTRLLKPNGILVLSVPAHQWLWTKRDEAHGHKRRYSFRDLRQLLNASGLSIEFMSYFNCFLFPLALAERLARKHLGLDRVGPDLSLPPAMMNTAMQMAFSAEAMILPHAHLPFGLSLIAIGRRT